MHSHVIWMGDLNYRINMAEPEIKMKLNQGRQHELLEYDQVSLCDKNGTQKLMYIYIPSYPLSDKPDEHSPCLMKVRSTSHLLTSMILEQTNMIQGNL